MAKAKRTNRQKIESALNRIGWQVSLKTLVRAAHLEETASNITFACQVRKKWMANNKVLSDYAKPRRKRAGQEIVPLPVTHETKRGVVFGILDRKGCQSSIPALIKAVQQAGEEISEAYAIKLRKEYCALHGLVPPDCRENDGQPERNMDRECSIEAWNFLVDLLDKYGVPFAEMRTFAHHFRSVRLQDAIRKMERSARVVGPNPDAPQPVVAIRGGRRGRRGRRPRLAQAA